MSSEPIFSKGLHTIQYTETHTLITLAVPSPYDIPKCIQEADCAGAGRLLRYGASVIEAERRLIDSTVRGSEVARDNLEIERRVFDATRRLQDELLGLRASCSRDIEDLGREKGRLAGEVAALRGQLAAAERAAAETERQLRDTIRADLEVGFNAVLRVKDNWIDEKERQLKARESQITELQGLLVAGAKAKENSAVVGRVGEATFAEIACEAGIEVRSSAKEGHRCDFQGTVGGMEVYFEVKNHARSIPGDDIKKFLPDMNEHPEIGAGVFIGMNASTGRGGVREGGGSFHFEWMEDGRLLVFINELLGSAAGPEYTLRIVRRILEAVGALRSTGSATDEVQKAVLEERIRGAVGIVESVGQNMRELGNKLIRDHRSSLDHLKLCMERNMAALDQLAGRSSAVQFEEEVLPTAEPPKKKARTSKKTTSGGPGTSAAEPSTRTNSCIQ